MVQWHTIFVYLHMFPLCLNCNRLRTSSFPITASTFTKCNRDDPQLGNCLMNAVTNALPYMKNGTYAGGVVMKVQVREIVQCGIEMDQWPYKFLLISTLCNQQEFLN